MEKDIGKVTKNDTTDVIIRIDDFGGRRGVTIREFVTSDRYTGFTKSGVRISAADFRKFKEIINSIDEEELKEEVAQKEEEKSGHKDISKKPASSNKDIDEEIPDY
ncbi:hypothetical protein K0A97_03265 [Patescibacteria group bacterium]|nr:hypothetical protein [Patescibacteria group bacterium]